MSMRDRKDIEADAKAIRTLWGGQLPEGGMLNLQLDVLLDIRDLLYDLRHVHGTANGPLTPPTH